MGTTKPRPSGKNSVAQIQALPDKTFIIDNGAYTMKAGYATDTDFPDDEESALSACTVIPNAIAKTRGNRTYVGAQIGANVTDWNEMLFRRPVEKGYTVNWEAQKEIWESSFFDEKTVRSKDLRVVDPEDTTLIFTEAPNALPALQKNADEIIMEEWGFGGYLRCIGKTETYIHCLWVDVRD
jgi:actin-related protein 6